MNEFKIASCLKMKIISVHIVSIQRTAVFLKTHDKITAFIQIFLYFETFLTRALFHKRSVNTHVFTQVIYHSSL